MSEKSALGEFEHQVLLATLRLGAEAYSVSIFSELESLVGRDLSLAAVYVALRRLEKKGLVRSRLVEPRRDSAAIHPRRYVRLTPAALRRLKQSRQTFFRLWDGVEPLLDES